jgi:hypothetical protein
LAGMAAAGRNSTCRPSGGGPLPSKPSQRDGHAAAMFRNGAAAVFRARRRRRGMFLAVERRKESSPRREPWETNFPGGQAAAQRKRNDP